MNGGDVVGVIIIIIVIIGLFFTYRNYKTMKRASERRPILQEISELTVDRSKLTNEQRSQLQEFKQRAHELIAEQNSEIKSFREFRQKITDLQSEQRADKASFEKQNSDRVSDSRMNRVRKRHAELGELNQTLETLNRDEQTREVEVDKLIKEYRSLRQTIR